jgi:hypothetical protein
MNQKIITITIILLLSSSVFFAFMSPSSAQSVVAGVSKGETLDYSYNLIWTSTDASLNPPSDLVEYNNTEKIQFKITDVSGPIISVDFVRLFKNGTQTIQSGTINIDSGTVTIPYGFLIIGANLSKNQQIYPTGGHQTITDTTTRVYPSAQRETNILSGGDPNSEYTTIYFDKLTGIAVDYSYAIYQALDESKINSTETLTNTNSAVWISIPTFTATSSPTNSASTTNPPSTPTVTPINTGLNPSVTQPSPTSNIGANTVSTSPEAATNRNQQSTGLIITGAVILIVIILAIVAVALRKKKKPISESEEIIRNLRSGPNGKNH